MTITQVAQTIDAQILCNEQLQSKVSTLEGLLHNIRSAIDEINKNAEANEAVAEKINTALN